MSRETDLAWVAGIFEGEGTAGFITLKRKWKDGFIHKYFIPMFKIGNTDTQILERCRVVFGFGHVSLDRKAGYVSRNGIVNRKDMYVFSTYSKNAVTAVALIIPYLISDYKKTQLETMRAGRRMEKVLWEVTR